MIDLKDAVHEKPYIEKVAEYELSTDVSDWNDEIMQKFFEEVSYIPKEFGVEVVVNSVDENKGYGKGSVVVWNGDKQINFPIIVKDYNLSPFDVFVFKKPGKSDIQYHSASEDNVKKVLASEQIATVARSQKGLAHKDVKGPGNIIPKQSVNVSNVPQEMRWPPFSKISHWPLLADPDKMEKLAVQLEAEPNVGASFVDNTGDLVSNVIELNTKTQKENRIVADDHKEGDLDLNDVVQAKQVVTVIDSQMIDTSKLTPMTAPTVCELRMYEYPTMEDFLESGANVAQRFLASKVGRPIVGVILDYMDQYDLDNCCSEPCMASSEASEEAKKKALRNRRNQIFISVDGKYYCTYDDYNKTGIGFYGSNVLTREGVIEKTIGIISNNTTDDFFNQNPDNRHDGSDKLFRAMQPMQQGIDNRGIEGPHYGTYGGWRTRLLVVYGAKDAWECVTFSGNFRKKMVNNTKVYVGDDIALIPSNVATIQRVGAVDDPVYKMVIGKIKKIYLIPESSKVINGCFMQRLNKDDFMRPSVSVQKVYEDAAINKVAMSVDSEGYRIEGECFEPLKKIAGLDRSLTTSEAITSLQIMGMEKSAAQEAMKVAINRASEGGSVNIYGVRGDYINPDSFAGREKTAKINGYLKEIASGLCRDLTKEASMLDDPEAVDVVLSLNFINENSLGNYIESIPEMKKVASKLAELVVASRMGLKEVDEGAAKKSMDSLNEVITGLEEVNMAVTR